MMSLYWLFGLAPDAVTALLPIALFPLLGVISTGQSCLPYMKVSSEVRILEHIIQRFRCKPAKLLAENLLT